MKNEILMQIINQIKNYELTKEFKNTEQFREWVSKLNKVQINNFLSLTIAYEDVYNWKKLLINSDLLNCDDYKQRVYAISKLKNGDGCWHLFDVLCRPNFLKSKNFYKDIEMLSKADTARYGLWILGEDSFIKSPYHDEDLKLIVETHDTKQENPLDSIVSDALATVAGNIDSIKNQYHQADMQLIAKIGSDCLQPRHSYPKSSLNNLAVNKVSLEDKYHLENMQILATNPISSEFLYKIMTNPEIIKGKYYRNEVEALAKAKSRLTARALYYYIVNPEDKFSFHTDYEYDDVNAWFRWGDYVSGKFDSDYINNLIKINQYDDKFVMHYVSLLMSPHFLNSTYKKFDLELLQNISNRAIFLDLFELMLDQNSLNSIHHKKDVVLISQSTIDDVRDLLLEKACYEYSLKSRNHEYDMEYISKLKLDSISERIYEEMRYYLFNEKGIDDSQHIEKLEKLLQGILVERSISVSNYLDSLQNQIQECKDNSIEIIESVSSDKKEETKILSLFKKYIKK